MTTNKVDRLEGILRGMIAKSNRTISSCVVTTERGLIVAGVVLDGSSNETLSAMVSLMSDTAARVCGNLGFSNPRTTVVRTADRIVVMSEFPVMDRRFRVGAVLNDSRKFSILRGRLSVEKRIPMERIDSLFSEVSSNVREILEEA